MQTPTLASLLVACVVATAQSSLLRSNSGSTCPGSPAFVHAKSELALAFANSCDAVAKVIVSRATDSHWVDPHNGGKYTLLADNRPASVLLSRAAGSQAKTPKGPKYDDQLKFTFTASGNSCQVQACSESHVTSVVDFGTNYCNMHDLICNNAEYCGDSSLSYTEKVVSCGTLGVNCKTSVEATCFKLKQPTTVQLMAATDAMCSLYLIQNGGCGQSDLDCKYAPYAKKFEKGLADGTCADHGYTVKGGTKTIKVPFIGDITVTQYSKQVVVGAFAGVPNSILSSVITKELLTFRSSGAWSGGGNGATAIKGATSLAEGAATTFESFAAALNACTSDACDVFFNFHTKYSFSHNAGAFGLARAQLQKDGGCDERFIKCFRLRDGKPATSDNTNQVTGLPHQLPVGAGSASVRLFWKHPFGENDLQLSARLSVDASLEGNSDIIGAHLHTGSDHVNGPVNVVFCGSAPLPAPLQLGGACRVF